jgi:hypothetical protein
MHEYVETNNKNLTVKNDSLHNNININNNNNTDDDDDDDGKKNKYIHHEQSAGSYKLF